MRTRDKLIDAIERLAQSHGLEVIHDPVWWGGKMGSIRLVVAHTFTVVIRMHYSFRKDRVRIGLNAGDKEVGLNNNDLDGHDLTFEEIPGFLNEVEDFVKRRLEQ